MECGNMIFNDEWESDGTKEFFSNFGVGEVITFQFHSDEGGQIIGIVKRVIFDCVKVRYDIQTLNGGVFKGIYSQRILKLKPEHKEILEREDNKTWVKETREEFQKKYE